MAPATRPHIRIRRITGLFADDAREPNLIKDLVVLRPNQVWVADITYWLTEAGYLYISLITDAYSHRIVGFAVTENLEAKTLSTCPGDGPQTNYQMNGAALNSS